jgi:hypothetical protein
MAKAESEARAQGIPVGPQNLPDTNEAATGVEHAANSAMLGYLPQVQAAAQKPIFGLLNKLTDQNVEPDSYVSARDANVDRLQRQAEEHPSAALAGDLAGTALSAYAAPLPAFKGAGLTSGALEGALVGGAQGALQNPGDEPGKVDPLQLGERAANASEGAKFGGLVGAGAGLGQKFGRALESAPEAAKTTAERTAFKGSGAMLKDFRKAAAKDQVEDIGRFMLDNKLIKAGDTVESVAEKARAFNKKAGEKLDKVYSKASEVLTNPEFAREAPGFNPVRDKEELLKFIEGRLGDSTDKRSALSAVSSYLDDLAEKYGDKVLDPKLANDVKGYMDEAINYARNPLTKQPGAEKAYSGARKWLNDKIAAGIEFVGEKSGDAKLAKELREANKEYGFSKNVATIAKDRLQREGANLSYGLTDRIAGGAGAAVGAAAATASGSHNPADIGIMSLGAGLLSAAGNKYGKKYGSGLIADGLNTFQPMLDNVGLVGKGAQGLIKPGLMTRMAVGADRKLKRGQGGKALPGQPLSIPVTEGYEQ